MTVNRFGHVDVRVADMDAAFPFYARLLPEVGFRIESRSARWRVLSAEGPLPAAPWFALTEETDHRPNRNRIAFWADSRAEVDRLTAVVLEAGGRNVSGPKAMPEYGPTYYAVFFEDPSGNCLEIVHTLE